jgi:hypothetical protein
MSGMGVTETTCDAGALEHAVSKRSHQWLRFMGATYSEIYFMFQLRM